MLSPCSAEMGMTVRSGISELGRERRELVADAVIHLLGVVDQIHLVDRQHQVRHAQQAREEGVAPVCSTMPLRASTRMMARSAVEAPVTMLRVYWMWPGVSAMMNLRFGVAK